MKSFSIIDERLINQQIACTHFTKPEEIVTYMGAMQSQDYSMAKWAIGLRLPHCKKTTVDKAFNDGLIVRTHVLRPTWHFVSPKDIRWMLALTAPHVHAKNEYMYRKMELDKPLLKKAAGKIAKTLEGGHHKTREELKTALGKAKITADGIRLSCIMMYAELEAVICSGPKIGNQFSYALMDERVPAVEPLTRDEALAELAARYFTSRGPATVQDLAYWSGLTVKDARAGVASLSKNFIREIVDGIEYVFLPRSSENDPAGVKKKSTFLMPDYDEYGMSYKDRSAYYNNNIKSVELGNDAIFSHLFVVDGMFGGNWKRTVEKNRISVETIPLVKLSKAKEAALAKAVKQYCSFFDSGKSPS